MWDFPSRSGTPFPHKQAQLGITLGSMHRIADGSRKTVPGRVCAFERAGGRRLKVSDGSR